MCLEFIASKPLHNMQTLGNNANTLIHSSLTYIYEIIGLFHIGCLVMNVFRSVCILVYCNPFKHSNKFWCMKSTVVFRLPLNKELFPVHPQTGLKRADWYFSYHIFWKK